MSRGSTAKRDAALIVWDVGITSLCCVGNETFFDASKKCIKKLICNKLLVQTKDLMGIIQFGAEETSHELNQEGFDNICMNYNLQAANFNMLEFIENVKPTDMKGDWLGALCVALHTLRISTFGLNKKNIVLVSPLSEEVITGELQTIMKGIMKVDAKVIIIGPDINLDEKHSDIIGFEETLPIDNALYELKENVPCHIWNFEEAMMNLTNGYTSRQVISRPWKVDLEIGSSLKIKVAGYNEITSEDKPKFTTLTEADMEKTVQREKAHFEKGSKRKFVDPDEIIQGHKFGTTIVPFGKADKEALSYKAGDKCLRVVCFVHKSNISPAMYFNCTTQMFVPQESDPISRKAFSALVRAMNEKQLAALVRKVAVKDGRLIFGVLLPQIRVDEGPRLMLVELPYADDARLYRFKRQDVSVTQDQLDVIDELMDSMDLMSALPNCEEAFAARETSDPTLVHFNEMLIFRAMHPGEPLPSASPKVLALLDTPRSIKLVQEKIGSKLLAAFEVDKERKRLGRPGTTRKTGSDAMVPDEISVDTSPLLGANNLPLTQPLVPAGTPVSSDQKIVAVGSVIPAEDFQELIRQGRPLAEVCQQCLGVVLQLATLATANEEISKPLTAVRAMRRACLRQDPLLYNKLIREIRSTLEDRERTLLWDAIRAENLGLITRDEYPLGGVPMEEAIEFLRSENATNVTTMSMNMDDIM